MKYTILVHLFLILLVTCSCSCQRNVCTNPFAENYDPAATESRGDCILEREKFLGTFSYTRVCNFDTIQHTTTNIRIEAVDSVDNMVKIIDYMFTDDILLAVISGENIYLDPDGEAWHIYNASGSISKDRTKITFFAEHPAPQPSNLPPMSCTTYAIRE